MNNLGQEFTSNDDGGPGLNSSLRFMPLVTGTYYINAGAYSTELGDYRLTVSAVAPQNPLNTIDWGAQLANPSNVQVYFAQAGESFGGHTATRSWTPAEIASAMAAAGRMVRRRQHQLRPDRFLGWGDDGAGARHDSGRLRPDEHAPGQPRGRRL